MAERTTRRLKNLSVNPQRTLNDAGRDAMMPSRKPVRQWRRRTGPFNRESRAFTRCALIVLSAALIAGCATASARGESVADHPQRALFVGNSYTYYNDIPMQIARMAESAGLAAVETRAITGGGAPLEEHVENPDTMPIITEGWDVVILQGHSLVPLGDPERFLDAVRVLATAGREAGADIFLYETWARQAGSSEYEEPWSGGAPGPMQEALSAVYEEAANAHDAAIVPVGTARAWFAHEHPHVPLYLPDGSHPTSQASFFAASLIFAYVFEIDPGDLEYVPWGVTEDEARLIRAAVALWMENRRP